MKSKNSLIIIITLYAITVVFWFALLIFIKYSIFNEEILNLLKSFTQIPLMVVPLVGSVLGLRNYIIWGGIKNNLGKSSLFLSLGLFSWASGMIIWNYYLFFTDISVPYPSFADVIFVLSWPFWTYGIWQLSTAVGIKFAIRKMKKVYFLIPLIFIILSIYLSVFVARGGIIYENFPKLFFDLFYPLGDIVILTVTVSVYLLLRKFLGGVYKIPMLILLSGFLLNYIGDFIFVFTTNQGTYYNGHFVDFLYTTILFILSLGVVTLDPRRISNMLRDNLIKVDNDKSYLLNNSTKILKQIIITIIKKQEKFAGVVAWEEAKDVDGLVIVDQVKGEISISDNSNENLKKIINQLVGVYKKLFGDLAVEVSKSTAYHLIMKLPPEEVPDSLR